METKTCSTCIHLASVDGRRFPECSKITHGGKKFVAGDHVPFICRDRQSGEPTLAIQDAGRFGCLLHEEKLKFSSGQILRSAGEVAELLRSREDLSDFGEPNAFLRSRSAVEGYPERVFVVVIREGGVFEPRICREGRGSIGLLTLSRFHGLEEAINQVAALVFALGYREVV